MSCCSIVTYAMLFTLTVASFAVGLCCLLAAPHTLDSAVFIVGIAAMSAFPVLLIVSIVVYCASR